MCKPPPSPELPLEGRTCVSCQLCSCTLPQRRHAFEAHAADAASYLPGAAAACCCPMLLLFGNQTLLHSQVMTLAHCAFKMYLASIAGDDDG